jgi:hypothetical protein
MQEVERGIWEAGSRNHKVGLSLLVASWVSYQLFVNRFSYAASGTTSVVASRSIV